MFYRTLVTRWPHYEDGLLEFGDYLDKRERGAEAEALLKDGLIALYDVRPAEDYAVQHAAGAISFPEADAAARTGELPVDQALVFY